MGKADVFEDCLGTVFRSTPIVRANLGGGNELLYFPLQRSREIFSASDSDILAACSEFRTLVEHALYTGARLNVTPETILPRLIEFVARGILTPPAFYLDSAARLQTRGNRGGQISSLVVPTRGRPLKLKAALESYVANIQRFGRKCALLVVDDSPLGDVRSEFTANIIGGTSGLEVFYAGHREKRTFSKLLTKGGDIPNRVVRFALFGDCHGSATYGANRNAALLHTVGETIVSVDDDTMCELRAAHRTDDSGTLVLGSDHESPAMWAFNDRVSALRSMEKIDVDFIAEHERFLGVSVLTAVHLAATLSRVDLRRACSHLLSSLCSEKGQVRLTLNGAYGDSAFLSGESLVFASDPDTRSRTLSSEASYLTATTSREVVRQFLNPTLGHAGPFMGIAFGLDNRALLPPFFPLYRGEDDLCGMIMAKVIDDCYAAHLPFGLLHDPPDHRQNVHLTGFLLTCSGIVAAIVSSAPKCSLPAPTRSRLKRLGEYLTDFGSQTDEDFYESTRSLVCHLVSGSILRQKTLAKECESFPSFWVRDLRSRISAYQDAIVKRNFSLPVELIGRCTPAMARRQLRMLVRDYGQLLFWWPDIVEKTARLAAQGNRLARRVS